VFVGGDDLQGIFAPEVSVHSTGRYLGLAVLPDRVVGPPALPAPHDAELAHDALHLLAPYPDLLLGTRLSVIWREPFLKP
jgi:hypothetical protein